MLFVDLYSTLLCSLLWLDRSRLWAGFLRASPDLADPGQFSLCSVFLLFMDSYPGVVLIPVVISPVGAAWPGTQLSPDSPDCVLFLAPSLPSLLLCLRSRSRRRQWSLVFRGRSQLGLVLSLRGLSRFLFARFRCVSKCRHTWSVCCAECSAAPHSWHLGLIFGSYSLQALPEAIMHREYLSNSVGKRLWSSIDPGVPKDYADCQLELSPGSSSSSFCLFYASALICFIILLSTSYLERWRFCIL